MLAPEYASLLHAAKMFIVSVVENGDGHHMGSVLPSVNMSYSSNPPSESSDLAKFLASKIQAARQSSCARSGHEDHEDTVLSQLNHYLKDVCDEHVPDGFTFWARKLSRYSKLSDLAEDLMAAPVSQAYVERIFSLTGQLTVGRRNRMTKSLEMRAFLELNLKQLN